MAAFLVIAGIVGVAGGIVAIAKAARRSEEGRVAALGAVADRLGWSFRDQVAYDAIPGLDRFELFRQGRARTLRNLMTSPRGDPRGVLFEYSYTVSTGKSQHTRRQTVFFGTSDALRLPVFSLRPEHFLHRVATIFGYQDIDIERRPTFSEQFLLRGEDEAAVRRAFDDDVLRFFEVRPGVCAAGGGHELFYWKPDRLARPDEIESLIADGMELTRRFSGARE